MPREVHETYEIDPDDPENQDKHRLVGYVVITRESPWDDNTRARALALTEYEDSLCSCGCGLPREVAHNDQPFRVDSFKCYASRAIRLAKEKLHKKHPDEWFEDRHFFASPVKTEAADN